jgi:hypothetical protein
MIKEPEDEAFDELEKAQQRRAVFEDDDDIQIYKKPWVDLTDSQIEQIYYDLVKIYRGAPMPWGQIQFGKVLQAAIKEKNG